MLCYKIHVPFVLFWNKVSQLIRSLAWKLFFFTIIWQIIWILMKMRSKCMHYSLWSAQTLKTTIKHKHMDQLCLTLTMSAIRSNSPPRHLQPTVYVRFQTQNSPSQRSASSSIVNLTPLCIPQSPNTQFLILLTNQKPVSNFPIQWNPAGVSGFCYWSQFSVPYPNPNVAKDVV
jgi:hypothetical protein